MRVKFFLAVIALISFLVYFYYGNLYVNTITLLINYMVLVVTMPFLFILFGKMLSKGKFFMISGMHSIDIYLIHGAIIIILSHLIFDEPIKIITYVIGVMLSTFVFGLIRRQLVNC